MSFISSTQPLPLITWVRRKEVSKYVLGKVSHLKLGLCVMQTQSIKVTAMTGRNQMVFQVFPIKALFHGKRRISSIFNFLLFLEY